MEKMDPTLTFYVKTMTPFLKGYMKKLDEAMLGRKCRQVLRTGSVSVTVSYLSPYSAHTLCNALISGKGIRVHLFLNDIALYDDILCSVPLNMKKSMIRSADCRRLHHKKCSVKCSGGYRFQMDDLSFAKCRNNAFCFELNQNTLPSILQLLQAQLYIEKGEEQ